jgi:hypothetical protein
MAMKQLGKYLAMLLIASTAFNGTAQAVDSQESSVATVGKSTFYGALTGLLVGGAAALVSGGSSGEILKWSFVGGTAAGFIWGVHDVSTRPDQRAAMFSLGGDGSTLVSFPSPQLSLSDDGSLGFDMTVFSLAF